MQNSQEHEIVLYQIDDSNVCVSVTFKDETFWLSQNGMAELFGVNIPDVSKHLSNIFLEGELEKESTVSKMEIVQNEGGRFVRRRKDYYNLDAIIAVGYRVNSKKSYKVPSVGDKNTERIYYKRLRSNGSFDAKDNKSATHVADQHV